MKRWLVLAGVLFGCARPSTPRAPAPLTLADLEPRVPEAVCTVHVKRSRSGSPGVVRPVDEHVLRAYEGSRRVRSERINRSLGEVYQVPTTYSHSPDGRTVVAFRDSALVRRVERDEAGRIVHRTDFDGNGRPYLEESRLRERSGTIEVTIHRAEWNETTRITYTYDAADRLAACRSRRDADSYSFEDVSTYEYGARCTSVHRVADDPRGMTFSADPVRALEGAGPGGSVL